MYFITGGSFNGKGKWVRKHFGLKSIDTEWVRLFNKGMEEVRPSMPILVLEGLEYAVRFALLRGGCDIREEFFHRIEELKKWEEEHPERKVIWIGSEIGKGIVPIDRISREWRDVTGWIYQDLAERSHHVWLVWYGMATSIKG
ncbi:bifunctional adenosylcobinamide kinase/adenosylcobinamide-phosphate guanylyltransferase [Rossellomorea sp. SC111]|uniref:bifunctional adenosylcobinamide kinase/adenosylcobinamide-phosphate guanylyltransferase n=1 Tax=Rossellomorea sp. SC111 TaxID=2968985 RepID=UPI00215ABAAD|nr:bifunctional adenosylcobinamide kinase/adenosylcobinamide-phosphate guanylyltransferase [Rossellomorea sp. SC111]MCR8847259.1 bifunctional adenosylcobinamide kinase/adenosylcobinamide-phosphate guanylyltransferase [Rossellomorea sp. SC111]